MFESFRKNRKGILMMLLSSICVCLGQLFWKLSIDHDIFFMIIGFCFYGAGALIMVIAYRFGKLSVLQPMLSFSYIISIILAATVLNETITLTKCIGIIIIIIGIVLIAGGDNQ